MRFGRQRHDERRDSALGQVYAAVTNQPARYLALLDRHRFAGDDAQLRREALDQAQAVALVRVQFARAVARREPDALDLPMPLKPLRALRALGRLQYALAALADEQAVPEMLLTREEVDGLVEQYALAPWLTAVQAWITQDPEGTPA